MKVLQINSVCGTGSTGRIVTDLHDTIVKAGHESYVAFGRGRVNRIDSKYTIKIGNRISNFTHLMRTRIFDSHGLGSYFATKRFIKDIKSKNFDVIHLHNVHGYYINIKVLFKFLSKFEGKIVWTFHDAWPFTGHSAYFDYPEVEGWIDGIHNCIGKHNYPKSLIFDRRKRNAKLKKHLFSNLNNVTIVTPSIWLKNLVKNSFLSKFDIKVINNGIDLDLFKNKVINEKKHQKTLLGVASPWSKRKGLDIFIKLSESLGEEYQIVLVGLSKNEIKTIPSNVVALPKTQNIEHLVQLYNKAFIYINPTFEDNFPTTNIESLACGTPVITFNTGGSPEIIDQSTGVVTVEKDVESIIKAINKIENMDYQKIQIDSRKRAEHLYSKDARFKDYILLYKDMR